MNVISVYNDLIEDDVFVSQNGDLSIAMFNRISRRAELDLIDFLTGKISVDGIPKIYTEQKVKDWLSPFIVEYSAQAQGGLIPRPGDYYTYDNMKRIGSKVGAGCEDDISEDESDTPITILDGSQFDHLCNTYVDELRPSMKNPICKLKGAGFQFAPKDIGSVVLEYIRFPKFASITPAIDEQYNIEVPGASVDYEWDERSRGMLIWFMTDNFAKHIREQALKVLNDSQNPKNG